MLDSRQAQIPHSVYTAHIMKGGGVATVGAAGSAGVVGRASISPKGSMRGFGVSLSLEARPGGVVSTSSLTSRDRGMMVNKSSFFGLNQKGMIDKSRPVFKEKLSGFPVARALVWGTGISQVSRADVTHQAGSRMEARMSTAQRNKEFNLNPPKNEQSVKSSDQLKNTIILWQRSAGEQASRISEVSNEGDKRSVQEQAKPKKSTVEHYRAQRIEGVQKIRAVKERKARKLSHQVRISKDVPQTKLAEIRADIKDAKKTIYVIMKARGVSYKEAQNELIVQLSQKHSVKIEVVAQPHEDVKPKQSPEAKSKVQPLIVAETKAQYADSSDLTKENKKKKRENREGYAVRTKLKRWIFHFIKHEEVNEARVEKAVEAFSRRLDKQGPFILPTGKEIAQEIEENAGPEIKSEISEFMFKDYSFDLFLNQISVLGRLIIADTASLKPLIRKIADTATAVKFTQNSNGGHIVSEQQVATVLGGGVEKKDVFFAEHDKSLGDLAKDSEGDLWFIPKNRYLGSELGTNWAICNKSEKIFIE